MLAPCRPFQSCLTFVDKASGLYYKSFRIVIYDRNNSTIVEPVLQNYEYDRNLQYKPNLALAWIVNYDRKHL